MIIINLYILFFFNKKCFFSNFFSISFKLYKPYFYLFFNFFFLKKQTNVLKHKLVFKTHLIKNNFFIKPLNKYLIHYKNFPVFTGNLIFFLKFFKNNNYLEQKKFAHKFIYHNKIKIFSIFINFSKNYKNTQYFFLKKIFFFNNKHFIKHIFLSYFLIGYNYFCIFIFNFYFNFYFNKNYFVFFNKIIKRSKINLLHFLNYLSLIYDNNIVLGHNFFFNTFSNNFLKGLFNFFDDNFIFFVKKTQSKNFIFFNNLYPIFLSNKFLYNFYFKNLKNDYNLVYSQFANKFVVGFLEKNFKKFIYIKYFNNISNKINNFFFNNLILDYKKFQPAYWKTYLVKDFIELVWYSFLLKDISILSNWISIFMETLNFKNHKKFLNFFLNFIIKNENIFTNVLNIKGFFFDIRGKVGVTGSSKKRHLFFKFGSLKKSSKDNKINFNQNLVRTYSGVMGLTYIINY